MSRAASARQPVQPNSNRVVTRIPGFLQYALRRYWLPAVVVVSVVTLLVVVAGRRFGVDQVLYESRAIVVAETLEIRTEELARTADALFSAGEVAAFVAGDPAVPYSADALIPAHLNLDPVDGTIVLEVVGIDESPQVARAIGDSAANALVTQLNRVGAGLGTFLVHTPAPLPTTPSRSPLPTSRIGVLAGILTAVGLVALKFSYAPPLLRPFDAAATADVPLLGEVRITASNPADPRDIPGMATTAETLDLRAGATRFFIGTHISSRRMSNFGLALAHLLADEGAQVVLVDPTITGRRVKGERATVSYQVDGAYIPYREDVTIFAARQWSPFAWNSKKVDIRPQLGPITLVVGAGTTARQIRSVLATLDGKIDGVVFSHLPRLLETRFLHLARQRLQAIRTTDGPPPGPSDTAGSS